MPRARPCSVPDGPGSPLAPPAPSRLSGMVRRGALAACALLTLSAWTSPAAAQGPRLTAGLTGAAWHPSEGAAAVRPLVGGGAGSVELLVGGAGRPRPGAAETTRPPGIVFLASLALPGAGQAMLGEGRWVLYAALEAWSWLRWADRSSRGRELADEYRELAREVARRISTGRRPEGSFDYYEALTHFASSGAFDHSQDEPGIQPETDPETHNGRVWELAQAIYLPGGEGEPGTEAYQRALDYYRDNAVGPEFAWSWGANGLEQQVYQDLIRGSDEAVRDATSLLGIILANHIVSGIDALVIARLRDQRAHPPARLRGSFDPLTDRWTVSVQIQTPGR